MNKAPKKRKTADDFDARQTLLLKQLEERGTCCGKGGLSVTVGGQKEVIVGKFAVPGAAVNAEGVVDGAVIAAKGADGKRRTSHVPFAALQEPKRLGAHLAVIGLDPPIEIAHLKRVANYIHELSRLRRCRVFDREGIHRIEVDGTAHFIAVIGGEIIGPKGLSAEGIPPSQSIYASRGTLEAWRVGVKPFLAGNPLVVFGALMAFGAPCSYVFGIPVPSALLKGDTSLGKSSVAGITQSANYSPEELQNWSGTNNGNELLAATHCDAAMILDELGAKEQGELNSLVYRLSGGLTKAASTAAGELRAQKTIRCAILATGELTTAEQARAGKEVMRNGVEARLVTIPVEKPHGVFPTRPRGCRDRAEASDRLLAVLKANHGHAGPEFVRALIENQKELVRRAPTKVDRYREEIIERTECGKLAPIEGRVLMGFVTLALAGKLAVRFRILPVSRRDVMHAVCHVFGLWLTNWREGSESSQDRGLPVAREWFQKWAQSEFVPLAEWDTTTRKGLVGYVLDHKEEGRLYLVPVSVFGGVVCKGLAVKDVIKALQAADLLATHGKGLVWRQRMPGVPKDSELSRRKFYAIRGAILFDE